MNEPIEVTIQSKFLTDMPSVNVVTYYNTNLIVDVSEDYHISLSQDAVKADRFKLTFSDSNGSNDVNTTGPVGNKFINSFVVLQLQDFSNETGNLKIHLPITNGERNDFAIYINNNPQSVNGSFLA